MYIVTGGAGFIGSAFVSKLNSEGITDIVVVDELGSGEKWKNLRGKNFVEYIHKEEFRDMLLTESLPFDVTAIIHMGACSSTTEKDLDFLLENNLNYSKDLAEYAAEHDIRFIYASSAATYGGGEQGYSDQTPLKNLIPLNGYGFSKQLFDLHMERQEFGPKAVGLKFFNVFGPNEYHKEDMSSVVFKSWMQIKETGKVRLFKSYIPSFADGEQKRDFIYVKDCCDAMWWLLNNQEVTGVYNLGTGVARSWNDLVKAVFAALGEKPVIEYIDMPETLRNQYQYFTQADMEKFKDTGCPIEFTSLENAVKDYVVNYLEKEVPYL